MGFTSSAKTTDTMTESNDGGRRVRSVADGLAAAARSRRFALVARGRGPA
jgi:hypothetical protein